MSDDELFRHVHGEGAWCADEVGNGGISCLQTLLPAFWFYYIRQGGYAFTLSVCLLAGLCKKTTQPIFTKFGGKMAPGPRKKPLDFAGNPDHIKLGSG